MHTVGTLMQHSTAWPSAGVTTPSSALYRDSRARTAAAMLPPGAARGALGLEAVWLWRREEGGTR